jgi:hypothetical protein
LFLDSTTLCQLPAQNCISFIALTEIAHRRTSIQWLWLYVYNSNFHYFSREGLRPKQTKVCAQNKRGKEKISREESRSEGFAPKTREGSKGSHGRSHDRWFWPATIWRKIFSFSWFDEFLIKIWSAWEPYQLEEIFKFIFKWGTKLQGKNTPTKQVLERQYFSVAFWIKGRKSSLSNT